jgi:hypothetical protein
MLTFRAVSNIFTLISQTDNCNEFLRSGSKTPSDAQWLRCPALRDFPPDLIDFVGRPANAGFASDFL